MDNLLQNHDDDDSEDEQESGGDRRLERGQRTLVGLSSHETVEDSR